MFDPKIKGWTVAEWRERIDKFLVFYGDGDNGRALLDAIEARDTRIAELETLVKGLRENEQRAVPPSTAYVDTTDIDMGSQRWRFKL